MKLVRVHHRALAVILAGTLLAAGPVFTGAQEPHRHPAGHAPAQAVPLYDDLGTHSYRISTSVPLAQRYFDQGLRLYYAFNHVEAIRAFGEAQRLDPSCAMCFWGEALSYGPNINLPMDSASAVAAYAALQKARAVESKASERERALIQALAQRYEAVPSAASRARLDSAYARAMGELAARYPDDHEILVLRGEAEMDLRPWDYWADANKLVPAVEAAVRDFERVLAENPDHPGACHFFIHAVEERQPERAVPCAERLAALMPGAGHIVHMPGHIYIRVGRYMDAVEANRHAVHADETFIRDQNPAASIYTAGYYPHNYDFLAFAASMVGLGREAVTAADEVGRLIDRSLLSTLPLLQNHLARPYQLRIRFSRWQEILDAPAPDESLPHTRAMWHYAQGRALAATGRTAEARTQLERLRRIARGPEIEGMRMEFNESRSLLAIAERVLEGWILAAEGRKDDAAARLREAAELEDELIYGEPPEWTIPVRQDLGEVLLSAGRAADAERAFREDLERFPANGWSLSGLARALRAQGKNAEAAQVEAEFRRVWRAADVPAPGGIGL